MIIRPPGAAAVLQALYQSSEEETLMKMFLTRIGFGSTAVITGDITQVDLPRNVTSATVWGSAAVRKRWAEFHR